MKRVLSLVIIILLVLVVVAVLVFRSPLKSLMTNRPKLSPTVTIRPSPTPTSAPLPLPTAKEKTTVSLYFVALNDEGKSGEKIGCGDSLVQVKQEVPLTKVPLQTALQELLGVKDKYYGQSGLYNALASSKIQVNKVSINGSTASIYLTGSFSLGGVCDIPRVEGQLRATALQFPTITTANFYINDVPLQKALSQKGE